VPSSIEGSGVKMPDLPGHLLIERHPVLQFAIGRPVRKAPVICT
jgi:hypothetical protein